MADRFDTHLEAEQAAHLRAAVRARGLDPAVYARCLLEQALSAAHSAGAKSLDGDFNRLESFRGRRY